MLIVKGQIVCLIIPVAAGTIDAALGGIVWLGFLSIASLTALAGLRILQRFAKLERTWHQARASAEAIKALAWRFAMRVHPFDSYQQANGAQAEFLQQIKDEIGDLVSWDDENDWRSMSLITGAMWDLHNSPFEHRRIAYRLGRFDDQRAWYSARSARYEVHSRIWDFLFILCSGLAVLLGVLRLTGAFEINLVSLFGIFAAVIGTWTGVRQYTSLSSMYANAGSGLAMLAERISQVTEPDWSRTVDQVEEVIAREHAAWRVRRS
jgi:hypothetical protein